MRAFHRVSGDVRIDLPEGGVRMEVHGGAFSPPARRLIVSNEEFEELAAQIREGDVEKAELKRDLDRTKAALSGARSDDVDELKAVIVSQAREITRLRGESE